MNFVRRSLIPLLLITILLTSCGGQAAAGEPTQDINATVAVAAQTFAASLFQTQTALAPTITNTAPPSYFIAAGTAFTNRFRYPIRFLLSFSHNYRDVLYDYSKPILAIVWM